MISIAAIPAIRISPRSTAADATLASSGLIAPERRVRSKLVADQLQADRARALDQHRVARLDHAPRRADRPPRRRAPSSSGA